MLAVYEKIQQLQDDIATLKVDLNLIRVSVMKLRADLEEDFEYFDVKSNLYDGDIRLINDRISSVETLFPDYVAPLRDEISLLKQFISWLSLSQHLSCSVIRSHDDKIQFCVDEVGLLWGRFDGDSGNT